MKPLIIYRFLHSQQNSIPNWDNYFKVKALAIKKLPFMWSLTIQRIVCNFLKTETIVLLFGSGAMGGNLSSAKTFSSRNLKIKPVFKIEFARYWKGQWTCIQQPNLGPNPALDSHPSQSAKLEKQFPLQSKSVSTKWRQENHCLVKALMFFLQMS